MVVQGLDLELHVGVLGRPCAVRGAAGLVVRVVMVLDAAVGLRVLLRRGPASANVKTAPHRVLRETCGGGPTRAAPRAHELGQGGGGVVVGLLPVRDVAMRSCVLLRRGVESDRSETAPPPARASRNLWLRTHESGATTICVRTGALLGL